VNDDKHIFISVGSTSTQSQEDFVCAVEARLRAEGLIPHTVGRDTFSSDAPLKTVTELMGRCSGAVVIALERTYFAAGIDRRGSPRQAHLSEVRVATPWNQIEAAMAYASGLPLLVVIEKGIKNEGLLERGYDWYVQQLDLSPASLSTTEFVGVLSAWKQKLKDRTPDLKPATAAQSPDPGQMTINQLLGNLKASQLWSSLAALAALLAGAFSLGAHFFSKR
jgi:hypothetical protein